ncbi:conserved hypothetical protein [Mycoplasmoides gallisepticum str. R(low)]|uniref:Uncharacterized protein n=1 Tax=Mycoplasmoides gallisepticum (strain R(low / passage 15 / clone 2)) TaxID=710127 RepID=Q7NBS2_MYCGA|nr:hypothetical protein [Mycoplasmoides gallisepticum]AAP56541.1 conserved hypothetical protein [Mycoplasmoides gallisepticum str. R(low)]ADC30377.1 conserved hypothetical protein [Mycoplasmoides gallisepticum str. R(high)]
MSNHKPPILKRFLVSLAFFVFFLVLLFGFIYLFFSLLWYDKEFNPVKLYENFFSNQALTWFKRDGTYEWGRASYREFATMLPDPESPFGKIKNFIPILYNADSFLGTDNNQLKAGFFGYFIPLGISFVSSLFVSLIIYAIVRAIVRSIVKRNQRAQKLKAKKAVQAQRQEVNPNT